MLSSGEMNVADLPPIQVIERKVDGESIYFSLNSRRLWVLKKLRGEGLLKDGVVGVRVRDIKGKAEMERYTVENCSLTATLMREKERGGEEEGDGDGDGGGGGEDNDSDDVDVKARKETETEVVEEEEEEEEEKEEETEEVTRRVNAFAGFADSSSDEDSD